MKPSPKAKSTEAPGRDTAPAKGGKGPLSVVDRQDEGEDAPAPPKKSKKLWIVLIVLLLLGAGGGAGWHYLGGAKLFNGLLHKFDGPTEASSDAKTDAPPAGDAPAKVEPPPKPVFASLDPFTVNLLEENGDHYLQATIVFQVRDEKVEDLLKLYMPIVRDRVLLLLSSKHPSELMPAEGKQKLAQQLLTEARASVPGDDDDKGILNSYFASFVIQ